MEELLAAIGDRGPFAPLAERLRSVQAELADVAVELRSVGERPFTLDSVRPTMPFRAYAERELRYRMLLLSDPPRGEMLLKAAQAAVDRKWKQYEELAQLR